MSGEFEPRCAPPPGLVRPVAIDPSGRLGPTKGQAAGPRWRRVALGIYVPAEVAEHVPEQRILEQASRLPPGGAVTGWGSLRLAGSAYFDGLLDDGLTLLPVPLAFGGARVPKRDGRFAASEEPLDPSEIVTRVGVPCTSVIRALFDELRRPSDWREAVVSMDMAAAAGLVSISQMSAYLDSRSRWRRSSQARKALRYASEDSRSPAEPRLRLNWEVDAGLPRPFVNRPIFDLKGNLICVPDLLDEEAGLVVEYDGAAHRKARRHTRDVVREEKCRSVGLEYCKVTALDSTADRVARMHASRARALFLAPGQRRWTLELPPDWTPPESLDERFARDAWLAAQVRAERAV